MQNRVAGEIYKTLFNRPNSKPIMEYDTPARIAILGAGPIGVEAALYARYLGYDVDLYERGTIAENVRAWGHVSLFTPFAMNASPLGLAAIEAQNPQWSKPADDAMLTGSEWAERYLEPLARTDLVKRALQCQTEVLSVGRISMLKHEAPGSEERAETPFRLLLSDDDGQRAAWADIVIDATGCFGNPNNLGDAGVPAVGESQCRSAIHYGLPDIAAKDRDLFAGQHTLVVGSGYSAATSVVALAKLAEKSPGTRVSWVVRRQPTDGPISRIADDRLSARDQLAAMANQLAHDPNSVVSLLDNTRIERITQSESATGFEVEITGETESVVQVDQVIANVGYRPDWSISSELQVHHCYATDGPMKLAAKLLADAGNENTADCLDQTSHGGSTLVSPEPDYYVLGAKSYGRNSHFLYSVGLQQIRDLFAGIGGRENLDLYATISGPQS